MPTILEVEGLRKRFPIHRGLLRRVVGHVRAVDDVSFTIRRGETLSLVGESGCGKTTTSRCILRAVTATAGAIRFRTEAGNQLDVAALPKPELRPLRRRMQMIFQDPFSSLHPRMTVTDIIAEPLLVNGVRSLEERRRRVRELLDLVQLPAAYINRYPHALSDWPGCEMIWYEGALRDHLALDPTQDREIEGRVSGVGFAPGQEGGRLPAIDPALRARFVRKFMAFVDRRPCLTRLACHPALLALVERLVGGRPELFQDMALVKPAGGREKPWHQDHAYCNVALGTPIVGVWIPMGEVTPENGCMHMLAGGHTAGPRPHFKRRDRQICDTDVEAAGRVAVPMGAGDALFFDGKIPHGTPTNRTDAFRWAVQYHFRAARAVEVDDAARLAAFGSEGRDVTC